MKSTDEQLKIIKRGAAELIPEDELVKKLEKRIPLRIKWGADPSAPDIHLGHTVVLNKLRQLQELGHKVIFIIGDFTAMIGDPSGKSETRKPLSIDEVKKNADTYQDQVFKVLDHTRTEVVYNSEWLQKMDLQAVFELSSQYTVARMLERKDFKERFKKGVDITVLEFLYPLLQGYDSVHLQADIEVGGTDQKFNLLMGRTLQQRYGQEPQIIITLPLLEGTDGVQKMSKSLGNYIGITESPKEIFGKTMSISDKLMCRYYELLTDFDLNEIKKMHPNEAKKQIAHLLVARFHSAKEADKARDAFERVHKQKKQPEKKDIPLKLIDKNPFGEPKMPAYKLIVSTGQASTGSEARRLIRQQGVIVEDEYVKDENQLIDYSKEITIQVGKRKFVRVRAK